MYIFERCFCRTFQFCFRAARIAKPRQPIHKMKGIKKYTKSCRYLLQYPQLPVPVVRPLLQQ